MDLRASNAFQHYLRHVVLLARADGSGQESLLEIPADAYAESLDAMSELGVTPSTIASVQAKIREARLEQLNESEFDAVEAIILPRERPAIDVIADTFGTAPPPWRHVEQCRSDLNPILKSIGRVEVPNHPHLPYAGTGFLVGEGLLLTNRHVAAIFTSGTGRKGELRFISGLTAQVDLKQEVIPTDSIVMQVEETLLIHPYWDAALLRVTGIPADRKPLTLLARPLDAASLSGRDVLVVGYPAFDSRNGTEVQHRVFRHIYNVKRLQPGRLMDFRRVKSFGHTVQALAHDASTLGGNSGSAVIDLETLHVLGLHFGGDYLRANYSVPTWELLRDAAVRELRPQMTGDIQEAAPEWLSYWSATPPKTPADSAALDSPSQERRRVAPPADWIERFGLDDLAAMYRKEPTEVERLVRDSYPAEEAAEVLDDVDRLASERVELVESLFTPSPDPDLPEIVLLHGILGGHLQHVGASARRIWLSVWEMTVRGNLDAKLTLTSNGEADAYSAERLRLQPGGPLQSHYARMERRLRNRRFVVHAFGYDWRKSITKAADALHYFLEALAMNRGPRPVVLVAHSMGGLVASVYAARHPQWQDRVQRAVFIGSPLRGSFAPIEALLGEYPFLRKLEMVARGSTLGGLMAMARSFPGLLDMLPDPAVFPSAAAYYACTAWPSGMAPSQRWLDQSCGVKSLVRGSPLKDRVTLIAAVGHATVGEVEALNGNVGFRRTAAGDGTVPVRSAVPPGATGYRADQVHDQLPRQPEVIEAVMDLARTGRCKLPTIKDADVDASFPAVEQVALEIPEAALSSVQSRFAHGNVRQADIDWLFDPRLNVPWGGNNADPA